MWISELRYQGPRTQAYLGSPSIVRLPDGALVTSHDYFGRGAPRNMEGEIHLTSVYRSEDDGLTWQNVTQISGAFWSTLFTVGDALHLMGTTAKRGSVAIRRSEDGGFSWTHPADDKSGLISRAGRYDESPNYHCAPVPVLEHDGRVYRAFEDDGMQDHGRDFLACVVSAPVDADLLDASNWTMSNKLKFEHDKAPQYGEKATWLEGNVVADRAGQLWNVLRFNGRRNDMPLANLVAFVKIDEDGAALSFDYETGVWELPGGATKFTIRWDEGSEHYWTLANDQQADPSLWCRNKLSLYSSPDLATWTHRKLLLADNLECDPEASVRNTGFQYVDWIFDPADDGTILYLSRTAYDGADSFHNSNRITFSRIRDFRSTLTATR